MDRRRSWSRHRIRTTPSQQSGSARVGAGAGRKSLPVPPCAKLRDRSAQTGCLLVLVDASRSAHLDRAFPGEFATCLNGRAWLSDSAVADGNRDLGKILSGGASALRVVAIARPRCTSPYVCRGNNSDPPRPPEGHQTKNLPLGTASSEVRDCVAFGRGNGPRDYGCNPNSNYCERTFPRESETCSTRTAR